ncbi:kelch-like protein 26 [Ciona intestinalis]
MCVAGGRRDGGRLYTFGGSENLLISNGLNSMESYDPREGKWKSLKPMNERRSGLSGVVYNHEIYVKIYNMIGWHSGHVGFSLDYFSPSGYELKSVERYNIQTNTWTNVGSLNHERWGSCACVVNGKIYVIGGGYDDGDASKSIEAYDATINEWKIETNLETPRRWASVVAL